MSLLAAFRIRDSEPGVGQELIVVRGLRPRWSYFLRADTMNQLYGFYLLDEPDAPLSFTASLGLAVHARPASIFPASVVTVADRRIAAWMCP